MIKVKDGYAKLIGTTYQGSATQVLLSNGGDLEYSASSKASTLVQRNASQHIYATYFNSAISDEALTDIGSVYVRNTSDTFIRRVSKTQFYSILDDKFVTLDTTQSITGAKTFSTSVRFANNASIIQNQNDTSNYTIILKWYKNGASRNTYDPSIGQHNTGGDGNGSICILPYPTETSPWGGTVGLFISKGVLKLDGKSVALAENYYTKTESDERYVNVTGDTMTGPLIVKAAITGTQLISTIATGTSPLKVTSTTVVTNLNSDLLDGLHETSFFRARGDQSIASSVPTTTELATSNNLCGSWNVKYPGASGHLVQFNAGSGSTRYMQFYSTYSGSLYWRNSTDSTLNTKSWKTIVDSANYTGIVLKIGTATKGSATLPIYLNAGTPTACSTTLGVSITGNAATATKLQTARTINGTSFDGTANIVTAYWGTARTISLSGAVTGSASVNGSQNVTITTTYQFGSIDGRYVGGNKTANHGSSGTAYTADTYSSTFVNKAFVAFAERGSQAYANNGYVSTDTGVNIPLAGTAIFQWGASDTNKTQLYITPHNNSGVSNPAANEMLFYTSNGSGYTSAWTRVLTHRNYTNYTVTKTGGGASGTWGISITGTAASARKLYKIDGTSRTWSTSESVVGNGIVAYTDTTTSGRWDSCGSLFQFSNADNPTPGTNSHWLTQLWSGTSNKLGVRWRTNTGGWTTMQTILTNTNYISYADTRYVTSLGTNGTYVTWVKNGTTNNLTVPYSSYSGYLQSHDTRSTNNTPAQFFSGARFEFKYNSTDGLSNGGTYHGILHFKPYGGTTDFSGGQTHQLGFTDGGNLYMRTSTSSSAWGSWKLILTQTTADGRYVTSLGTNGNYLTWTKAGTTNNITVPYATNSATAGKLKLVSCYNGTTNNDLWSTIKTSNSSYIGTATVYEVYNDGGPTTYGEVLDIVSIHSNHWQPQLWFDSGKTGSIRHRNKDYNNNTWGSWYVLLDNNNYAGTLDSRYVTLTTNQTVSGIKTFSTQQKFTVATGTSPFTVTSTTVVTNLNSDLLDGMHLGNATGRIPYIVSFPVYSSFGSSTSTLDYEKNILKWIWTNQNHGGDTLLIGIGRPNSKGNLQIQLYGTSGVNSSTGYPQYSSAIYYPLGGRPICFGTTNYNFYSYSLAFSDDIKDPANYYWANIKVSASSNSGTSPTFSTAYTSNWFRSTGSTGWYSETYGGGWHMSDSTWLRAYNGKAVYTSNAGTQAFYAAGGFYSGGSGGNGLTIIGSESTTTRIKGQIGSSVNTAVARYEVQWYSNYARFDVHRGGSENISKWSFKYNSTEVTYLTTGGHLYANGFHHRSMDSNSYVLLAGGSYKALTDFAKGNAGSATKGVYVTGGTVTAMTYSLSANLNSGTSGKLAYYSSTNALSSYTTTVGSTHQPVYMSSGVPTICGYSFKGSSRQPIVLLSGVFYRSGTTWYMDSAKTHKVVDATPSITISGARMQITLPGTTISSGVVTQEQTTDFSASSTADVNSHGNGAYGFAVYSNAANYVYVRTWCQRDDKNHSWASNGESWTTFLMRIQVTLFGYIN